MRWWNNLWLNEGFASMVGLKAADYVDNVIVGMGEMSIMAARALRADQSPSSSPISRHIEESFNPDSAFNQITYRKIIILAYATLTQMMFLRVRFVAPVLMSLSAPIRFSYQAALIIAMVERIVGDDVFREGLRQLLIKFSYKNADHEDLLAVLTFVHNTCSKTHLIEQNFTLSEVIETWIYQNGFPILDVQKVDGRVKVSQKAYRHTGGRSRIDDYLQWKIPLFIRDPKSLEPSVHWLLENNTAVLDLGEDIVLDRNGQSFLRIRYDGLIYADIIERLHLDMNSIPVSARTRLMDDCFTLAETGNLSYAYTFNISAYLRHETAYPPINMLNAHLDFLVSRLNVHPNFDQFQKFIITLLVPHFERFINNPVSNEKIEMYQDKLAEIVFTRVCINGFPACLSHAHNLLSILRVSCRDSLLSNNTCNIIPTYVRQPLYAAAVMYGKGEEFEFFHEKWEKEIYDGEREKIWVGMAASRKKEHIHR
uniref:Peptidase_M1 domain-containing protein n=1 Tax=Heterorhabditis bacteriophora TaxID=37862 RepID=A0A1I7XM69_HETBA